MYPNNSTNYLNKFIKARRVAVFAIALCCISVLITIGYAKNANDAFDAAEYYQDSVWNAYLENDSLRNVISVMEGEKWFSDNLKNE